MKKLILITTLALFAGLQSSQAFLFFGDKTKTKNVDEQRHSYDQNAQTVDSTVHGERTPVPNVTVTGGTNTTNSVAVTINGNPAYTAQNHVNQAANLTTDTSDQENYLYKNKLPLSVACLIGAIGLLILLAAIKAWRAYSPSANAAIGFADTHLAAEIDKLSDMAAHSTDAKQIAQVQTLRASLEKARGKIRAYNPKKKTA